jgi:hypothetical protein
MAMRRRDLLLGALAAGLARPAAAAVSDGLLFRAVRNGSPIGWHRVLLHRDGERLVTEIEARFDVRILLIPVYRYRHSNRELWQGEQLLGFRSETDDNGERLRVEVERQGDGLLVDGPAGRFRVAEPLPPSTWWSRRLIGDGAWIDTQRGIVARSTVTSRGREQVDAAGQRVAAERLALAGDIDLELWYAEDRWVRLAFTAQDGSTVAYELAATGPAAAETAID